MKRKIPALLLALLLVFSAALPAGAAGYRCAVRLTAGGSSSATISASAAAIRRPEFRRSPSSRPSRNSPPSRRNRLNQNSPRSRPAVCPHPAMSSRSLRLSMPSVRNTALQPWRWTRRSAAMPASNRRTCTIKATSPTPVRPMVPRST